MTPQMKRFLDDLAELMDEHDISMMEVVQTNGLNGVEVEGVEFTRAKDGEFLDSAQVEGVWFEADDIRDAMKG